jgi:hypothetical protein
MQPYHEFYFFDLFFQQYLEFDLMYFSLLLFLYKALILAHYHDQVHFLFVVVYLNYHFDLIDEVHQLLLLKLMLSFENVEVLLHSTILSFSRHI